MSGMSHGACSTRSGPGSHSAQLWELGGALPNPGSQVPAKAHLGPTFPVGGLRSAVLALFRVRFIANVFCWSVFILSCSSNGCFSPMLFDFKVVPKISLPTPFIGITPYLFLSQTFRHE